MARTQEQLDKHRKVKIEFNLKNMRLINPKTDENIKNIKQLEEELEGYKK